MQKQWSLYMLCKMLLLHDVDFVQVR